MPWNYAIFIEDPFEQRVNAARTVKPSLMKKTSQAFETTYGRVSSTYQTEASLLPGLARPRALKALGRTHSGAGSHGGNHDRINRSVVSNVTSSSQVHQQFQNKSPLQDRGMVQKSLTRGDRLEGTDTKRVGSHFVEPETDLVDPRTGPEPSGKKHKINCSVVSIVTSSSQVHRQFQNTSLLQHRGIVQKSLTMGDRLGPKIHAKRVRSHFMEPRPNLADPRTGPDRPGKKHRPIWALFIFLSLVFFSKFPLS